MPSSPEVPRVLPHRLENGKPGVLPPGCSLIATIVLLGLGSAILFYGTAGAEKVWMAWLFGGGMCFLGVLFLWSWISQLFAMGTPVTWVEFSEYPLKPGVPVKMALVQPGPAALKSIRVTVTCKEVTGRVVNVSTGRRKPAKRQHMISEKLLHDLVLAEPREVRVIQGDVWQEVTEITLPAGAPATSMLTTPRIEWLLQVQGKLHGPGRFYQIHELKVSES